MAQSKSSNGQAGCLWWAVGIIILALAIFILAYAACAAVGVGLWFLIRYVWRRLSVEVPNSKFVKTFSGWSSTGRKVAAGVLCTFVSIILMAGLSQSLANTNNDNAAAPSQQTEQQVETTSTENDNASDDGSPSDSGSADAAVGGNDAPKTSGELVVRFLDVGQGDASLIEFPDGKTMLIDTPDGGASTVNAALSQDGRSGVDWLVATHPDADHIGGLDSVIQANSIGSVWAPEVNSSTRTYTRFLTAVADKGLSIEPCYAGRQIASGDGYTIDLLWPQQGASYSEDNGYSAIIRVTYGDNTFLFTGDAPVRAQSQCVNGHVDVLKVSHHGSASGMDAALAQKMTPDIAVLSYGKNSYGHPTQVVLDALTGAGAQVFGTYVNGTVTVTSDGTNVSASTEREGTIVAASKDAGISGKDGGSSNSSGSGDNGSNGNASGGDAQAGSSADNSTASGDSDTTAWVTPNGKKYHRQGCRTLSRSKNLTTMTRSQAEANGLTACDVCNP